MRNIEPGSLCLNFFLLLGGSMDKCKDKHPILRVLDGLFNRGLGTEDDTKWFKDVSHDELLTCLLTYLNANRHYLGYCRLENRQALNDRGVDILLEVDEFKSGFQIKSHGDIASKDFSANVKRQFAESLSHGLDHYYILICASLMGEGWDYREKVAHLLNELGLYQKISFDIFGPTQTVGIFMRPVAVPRDELLSQRAIAEGHLQDHEKGYEHLPEIDSADIRRARQRLDSFGPEFSFEEKECLEAYLDLERLIQRKQAEQFTKSFLPTLSPEVKQRRETLISDITHLLSQCRACEHWSNRSELKLSSWLDHIPEEMIPFTSIPNLLAIRPNLEKYLAIHKEMGDMGHIAP